jgi:hypothetical protein
MIEIKDKIERAFDQVSPEKLLKNWNRKTEKIILVFWAIIPLTLVLWSFVSNYGEQFSWIIPFSFIWMVLGAVIMFVSFNSNIKKKLIEIGINPTPGIFTFWANTEYREYKLNQFHVSLCNESLLTNSQRDIELTEQYLKFCDEESKDSYKAVTFIFGGVVLAFCVPVWNQYLTWLFKNTDSQHIGKTVLVSAAVVLLIVSFLVIVSLFLTAYTDHSNKTSTKFKEISKHLKKLNLNLKLKYP